RKLDVLDGSSAFGGGFMLPFVDDEPSQRCQKKCSKSSASTVCQVEQTLFQKSCEKRLRQILSLRLVNPQPTQIPVQRRPVGRAKLFPRGLRIRRCRDDQTPMSRPKMPWLTGVIGLGVHIAADVHTSSRPRTGSRI